MREFIFREQETTIPVKGKRLILYAELVRCKDCKHYGVDENCRLGNCLENGVCSTPDWFCADGERRDS